MVRFRCCDFSKWTHDLGSTEVAGELVGICTLRFLTFVRLGFTQLWLKLQPIRIMLRSTVNSRLRFFLAEARCAYALSSLGKNHGHLNPSSSLGLNVNFRLGVFAIDLETLGYGLLGTIKKRPKIESFLGCQHRFSDWPISPQWSHSIS